VVIVPDAFDCPDAATIDAYVRGDTDAALTAALDRHLLTCDLCRGLFDQARAEEALLEPLREAVGAGEPDDALEPDPAWPRCPGFRLARIIGRGGMGTVYEAYQQEPRRRVAIKVMDRCGTGSGSGSGNGTGNGTGSTGLDRFRREIDALAAVDHPMIAKVHSAGRTESGVPFMAMEFVEGLTLDRFAASVRDPAILCPILARLAEAVAAAHARAIVHRDLKPTNVIVKADGSITLVDFGLAVFLDDCDSGEGRKWPLPLTATMQVHGTPGYMSPERFRGTQPEPSADVFALGLIDWEVIAGRHPYCDHATDWITIAHRITGGAPPSLQSAADVPTWLSDLVALAVDPDPGKRPSAAEFAAILSGKGDRFSSRLSGSAASESVGDGNSARSPTHPDAAPLSSATARIARVGNSRFRWTLAMLGLAAIAIVPAILAEGWRGQQSPNEGAEQSRSVISPDLRPLFLGEGVVIAPGTSLDEAERLARDGVMNEPMGAIRTESRAAWERLALILEASGKRVEAVEIYRRLLRPGPRGLPPTPAQAALWSVRLARCQLTDGDVEGAAATVDRLLEDPIRSRGVDSPAVAVELGVLQAGILRDRGDPAKAETLLLQALSKADAFARSQSVDSSAGDGRWLVARVLADLVVVAERQGKSESARDFSARLAGLGDDEPMPLVGAPSDAKE
jgi:serine/threonine protein kinase